MPLEKSSGLATSTRTLPSRLAWPAWRRASSEPAPEVALTTSSAWAAAFAVVLLVPFLRAFFALDLPPLPVALTALALVAAVGGLLTLAVLRLRL